MQTVDAGAGRRQGPPAHVLLEGVEDVGPIIKREVDERVVVVELPRDIVLGGGRGCRCPRRGPGKQRPVLLEALGADLSLPGLEIQPRNLRPPAYDALIRG